MRLERSHPNRRRKCCWSDKRALSHSWQPHSRSNKIPFRKKTSRQIWNARIPVNLDFHTYPLFFAVSTSPVFITSLAAPAGALSAFLRRPAFSPSRYPQKKSLISFEQLYGYARTCMRGDFAQMLALSGYLRGKAGYLPEALGKNTSLAFRVCCCAPVRTLWPGHRIMPNWWQFTTRPLGVGQTACRGTNHRQL
jgi:hypothetical protein